MRRRGDQVAVSRCHGYAEADSQLEISRIVYGEAVSPCQIEQLTLVRRTVDSNQEGQTLQEFGCRGLIEALPALACNQCVAYLEPPQSGNRAVVGIEPVQGRIGDRVLFVGKAQARTIEASSANGISTYAADFYDDVKPGGRRGRND